MPVNKTTSGEQDNDRVKKFVVMGTGRMGGAFAKAFAKRTSHAVSIRGSHSGRPSAAALSRQLGLRVAGDRELLAAVAAELTGYARIIVSAMLPAAGGYELKRDDRTSAAEQLARLVPKGRVVTAFLRGPYCRAFDRDRPGKGDRL